MSTPSPARWPVAELDPIRRLDVLAAALPGVVVQHTVLDAPFAEVWPFLTDFERSVPSFDSSVRRVVVRSRTDAHVRLTAWSFPGLPGLRFEVDVEPGFCWMRSRWRVYVVGMAAVPDGARTRVAHLEGSALPGARLLRWFVAREVASDVAGMHRILDRQTGGHAGG